MNANKPFSMYGFIGTIKDGEDGMIGCLTEMGIFYLIGGNPSNMQHMSDLAMAAHISNPDAKIRVCHFKCEVVASEPLAGIEQAAIQEMLIKTMRNVK